jgi:hypothetical protein
MYLFNELREHFFIHCVKDYDARVEDQSRNQAAGIIILLGIIKVRAKWNLGDFI